MDGEQLVFEAEGISISNARVMTDKDSYVMRNITSCGMDERTVLEVDPERARLRTAGWILGFAAWAWLPVGDGKLSMLSWAAAIGLILYGGAKSAVVEHVLKVRTSAGEQAVWWSRDQRLTVQAYEALNRALTRLA